MWRARPRSLRTCASPLTVLSSRPRPAGWAGEWIELARDDDGNGSALDPTAGGAVHWAPLHHPGLRRRMATVAAWIDEVRPRLMVVDVSVEVALLARLMGIPVVRHGLAGDRSDAAHRLAYQAADGRAGPVAGLGAAGRRRRGPAASGRRDLPLCRPRARRHARPGRRVLVLMRPGRHRRCPPSSSTPLAPPRPAGNGRRSGRRWATGCADPWPALVDADVVVCHAGQNASRRSRPPSAPRS